MKVSSGILFSMLHDDDSWIVGLLDEHRAWRSVCVACCGLVVWKVVICVCDAMSGDGFDEAMDLLDRWIRGWRQRGR